MSFEPIPKERLQYLVAYVSAIQGAMNLDNWALWVAEVYSEDDSSEAYVEIAREKEVVHLYVRESFFDLSSEEKRQVMTHEMVHLMVHPLDVYFCLATNRMTDSDPFWCERLETVVDNIARRIAPNMPKWQGDDGEGDGDEAP